jgi:cellulose synthase/poly-beta-1,6-N-acetylglucosamine synthase-like glycosyltransferase
MDVERDFPPKVSLIITTFNNERTIDECLKSVFELDYPRDKLEVIVIDGGSGDSTVQIAEKYPAKIIVKPSNAPAAYNYAIKIANGDIIAILDADVKVEKNWLNKLVKYLKDPQVAGVGGGIETWNYQDALPRCIGYDIKYRYRRLLKNNSIKRLATMNLLLKRKVLEDVGGFDESLPTQYDTDICNRITSKGYKLIFKPDAKCYHFNRSTWREYFKQQLRYGKNTLRLYLRNPKLIKGDKITDFGMNIQPILLLIALASAILGLIFENTRSLLYVSVFILAFLIAYYIFCAVKISAFFKDFTAMLLVIVYFVRAVAWTLGGAVTVFDTLRNGRARQVG